MIELIKLVESNEGWASEVVFTRKLLQQVKDLKRPSLKYLGVINRIEIPVGGKNVLLFQRDADGSGKDYIRTRNIDEIIKVADQASKSDIIINGKGVSIKSFVGSSPSIASRISRSNFEKLIDKINITDKNMFMSSIDEHYKMCAERRLPCTLKASDEPYNRINSDDWEKLINYLAFQGTATRDSRNPADYVLEISGKHHSFKVYTRQEFAKTMIDRVRLWIVVTEKGWSLNIRMVE